jgi:hypothetical protein
VSPYLAFLSVRGRLLSGHRGSLVFEPRASALMQWPLGDLLTVSGRAVLHVGEMRSDTLLKFGKLLR